MKVVFHALPGMVLSNKESEQIIAGDGIYEETWVAQHKWRREVTFGSYHAIEAESESGRKMQASSDYEPSRVLMLLEAVLYPIPRDLVSPSLGEGHIRWKIENGVLGSLSYVKVSRTFTLHDILSAYLFLPTGSLVQSIEGAVVTSWQNPMMFSGKVVPRHFAVQGGTRDLLTADVTVESASPIDPAAFQLSGDPAEPGWTLRPLHYYDLSFSPPGTMYSYSEDSERRFQGMIRQILDRHGATREVEILYSPNPDAAAHLLPLIRGDKFRPARIDKGPCEFAIWKSF